MRLSYKPGDLPDLKYESIALRSRGIDCTLPYYLGTILRRVKISERNRTINSVSGEDLELSFR